MLRIKAEHESLTGIKEPYQSTTGVIGRFVFSQVLIDCLLRMKSNQQDKDELISCYKIEYEGNKIQLENRRKFQDDYSPDEAFCYRSLNKALRCQDIDMIFLYCSFITDIYRQLQQHQSNIPLHVYRSQWMAKEELENLRRSVGEFISVNSFLSTSKEYLTAVFLAGSKTEQTYMERVFFETDAGPKMATIQPFSDISVLSEFAEESEVLFMIGSIVRLNDISFGTDQAWIIRMTLCSGDEHDLKPVLAYMTKQNGS